MGDKDTKFNPVFAENRIDAGQNFAGFFRNDHIFEFKPEPIEEMPRRIAHKM